MWFDNCIPAFRSNTTPSSSGLSVRDLGHNPEDEGGVFLRNVRNNGATTLKTHFFKMFAVHCSNYCFVLLNIYLFLITVSFPFILFCGSTTGLRKNENINVFIIFGSQSPRIYQKTHLLTYLLHGAECVLRS